MFWHHALITCIRWFRTLHIYIHVFFAIICIVFLHHFFWHSTSCSLGAKSRHVLQELRQRNGHTVSSFGRHFYFGCHVHCSQSSLLYSSFLSTFGSTGDCKIVLVILVIQLQCKVKCFHRLRFQRNCISGICSVSPHRRFGCKCSKIPTGQRTMVQLLWQILVICQFGSRTSSSLLDLMGSNRSLGKPRPSLCSSF